ncbi:MAG TPA: nitrous oxide reductase family maturation protein NosD [Saprospiraceae bacterium]|nr:nitrous oxide reductase family maturation protein NosD [Saprospiraceae bacterium]HMQ85630.1 nitrous oxide reductase family maturation protein NosD [Saprospiraceae bacterium]
MKRRTLCFLLLCWVMALQAKIIVVCASCPIQSVKQAIEQAQDGDVVRIESGVYREGLLLVDKKISISGHNFPVLDGGGKDEILIIHADSVLVEGLEFRNAGRSNLKDLAALRIRRSRHFCIRNNRIFDAYFGIYVERSAQGCISDNQVLGKSEKEATSGNAIHAWYADSLEIVNNYLSGYRDGIYLEFVNHSQVADNLSEGNLRYGLHFMFSNDDEYGCNTFRDNGAGVAVMFSKRIFMFDNLFDHNWGTAAYGLLLKEIYDAHIAGNRFTQNTIGIFLEGATRIEYRHNLFKNNGWAIQMTGGCLDNHFSANDFETNTLDMVVNSRVNNNTFNGNYWSEYAGYDLDRDGTGDVPHRPVKLFSYILNQSPESIVLLRSFFIDLLNYSEKISPVFTPQEVSDQSPLMQSVL